MIKLKDLLKELDLGKFPFSDPAAANIDDVDSKELLRLIARYDYEEEPNTKSENSFLKDLSKYFEEENNPVSLSALKALLSVKSKFPGILNPAENEDISYVYRGTSMPISEVMKYNWDTYSNSYNGISCECKSPVMITAKGTRGFSSFSIFEDTADEFAYQQYVDFPAIYIQKNLVPVVTSVYVSDPKALFNPEFSRIFNVHGNEGEVLLIDTKYKSPKTTIKYLKEVFENIKDQGTPTSEWIALAKHLKIEI